MNIEVKIEGTKELTKALVDIFSPLSEFFGAMGDKIRVYRQLSLLKTLQRAQEIANESGIKLSPPPLKFLLPFMEECSLEEQDEDEIIDLWSNLLVSAAKDFSPEHNLFVRLIKEMTSSEARLLDYISSEREGRKSKDHWHIEDAHSEWKDNYIFIKIRDLLGVTEKEIGSKYHFYGLEARLKNVLEYPGNHIFHFSVVKGSKNCFPYSEVYNSRPSELEDNFDRYSVEILKHLGLVGEYQSSDLWFGKYCFRVCAYFVTPLGARFLEACTSKKRTNFEEWISSRGA